MEVIPILSTFVCTTVPFPQIRGLAKRRGGFDLVRNGSARPLKVAVLLTASIVALFCKVEAVKSNFSFQKGLYGATVVPNASTEHESCWKS